MTSNIEHNYIKSLINNDSIDYNLTNEELINVINNFETLTRMHIYNKEHIIQKIINSDKQQNQTDLNRNIKELINENVIGEIDYDIMFTNKSKLNFQLLFRQDDILLFFNSKIIKENNIYELKAEFQKLDFLTEIPDLFIKTLCIIIKKLINKDLTVKYHLKNCAVPFWNLFEIKSKKDGKQNIHSFEQYDSIINGTKFKESSIEIIENIEEKDNFEVNEIDNMYQLEILSYLNDEDTILFLEIVLNINNLYIKTKQNQSYYNEYINNLLIIIDNKQSIIYELYFLNKLIKFMIETKETLLNNNELMGQLKTKLLNFKDSELYDIMTVSTYLFSSELINNFNIINNDYNLQIPLNNYSEENSD